MRLKKDFIPEISQRVSFFSFAILLLAGLFTWRLFQKSVLEHGIYEAQAANQYEVSEKLIPRRGVILSQDSELGSPVPIASTEELFNVSVVPKNVKDKREAAKTIAEIFNVKESEIFEAINNDKLYIPPLVKGVNKAKKDELVARGFTGLLIEREYRRVYPEHFTAAQLLGFVNREGQGSYGIEGYYNKILVGKEGRVLGEKDTMGRVVVTKERIEPQHGAAIETSIDHNVQFSIEERLAKTVKEVGAASGQVILIDPNNGEIIAMAATPSFDPNKYNEYAAKKDGLEVFQNPSVNTVYEPGSIMKPIVMSLAMNYGKVTKETTQTFGSSVYVRPHTISNAVSRAFGRSTMADVIKNSDNVGMVWTSSHMTYKEMYDGFVNYGFAENTGIDLTGEVKGFLLNYKDWRDINRATMSFGQGISASPIQMVRAWAALINGGKLIVPHVARKIADENGDLKAVKYEEVPGVISEDISKTMREILEYTVEKGFYGNVRLPSHRIGAKTGTAQIAGPNGGYLENEYTHSVFAFFPVDKPRFLMLTKIDKPTKGLFAESTTGPLVKDILQYLINYYKIPPDKIPAE